MPSVLAELYVEGSRQDLLALALRYAMIRDGILRHAFRQLLAHGQRSRCPRNRSFDKVATFTIARAFGTRISARAWVVHVTDLCS